MKILTIGAGVIGTTNFWQLQKAGYDLTHLVKEEKGQANNTFKSMYFKISEKRGAKNRKNCFSFK